MEFRLIRADGHGRFTPVQGGEVVEGGIAPMGLWAKRPSDGAQIVDSFGA
jgi:hypothetical protein